MDIIFGNACVSNSSDIFLRQLPFSPLKDGTSGPSSWKPVKDLVRFCMAQSSGDDPKVEIRDYCYKTFLPQAFVKLKKEENARLVFGKFFFTTLPLDVSMNWGKKMINF